LVKRTIDTLVESGVILQPQIEDGERSKNNTIPKVYRLTKRDSYVVFAQSSPEFTTRLVDRWRELEGYISNRPVKTHQHIS
jgi:phage regulator Rha-like protein